MIREILSFFLGALIFPLAYACMPLIISEVSKKRRYKPEEKLNLKMSDRLKINLEKALLKCNNVFWANSILQRFYSEIIKNYAFENRMRNILLKNFIPALKTGVIKNVRIISLEFGHEAPYINSAKILSKSDLEAITQDTADADDIDLEQLSISLENQILNKVNESDPNILIKFPVSEHFESTKSSSQYINRISAESNMIQDKNTLPEDIPDLQAIEFMESAHPFKSVTQEMSENALKEMYKHLVSVFEVEYFGGCNICLEIELPKGIFVNSTIALKHFKGRCLLRMPAENYDTRYEISFLKDTKFTFDVESGINTGKSKIFFQSSISSFLKTAILYTIRKVVVYPNWFPQLMSFLPSTKEIDHKITKITAESLGEAANLAEKILLYLSSDYKIISVKDDIFFREYGYSINFDGILSQAHFQLPKNRALFSNEMQVYFEGLDSQDSRLLNKFADMSIFEGVISGFKEMNIIHSFKNYSLVTAIFNSNSYEFIRITSQNTVIFQRNDPLKPEFFAFKVMNKSLHIFSYANTSNFEMTERRIMKIKRKVYAQPMSMLGSNILYKFIHIGRKNNYRLQSNFDNGESEFSEAGALNTGVSELEDVFFEALKIPDTELIMKTLNFSLGKEELFEILKNDNLRLKLFSDNGKICKTLFDSNKIKTIVIEEIKNVNDFVLRNTIEEIVTYSYVSTDFIVDIVLDSNLIYILRVENNTETEKDLVLNIITKKETPVNLLNIFIETLQIRISLRRFLGFSETLTSERDTSQFIKEIKTTSGCLWFEFYTEFEDDFKLKIISCKKRATLLDIYKVITNRKCRILIPTENDFVKIILIPKFKRNKYVMYKLGSINLYQESFVDATIGLGHGSKFTLKIKGTPSNVIFWEKEYDSSIESYVEDSETRNAIEKSGLIRMENRDYSIVYKNRENKKRNIKIFLGSILMK